MVVIVGGGGLCTTTLKVLVVVVVATAPPAQSCTVVVVVIVGGGFCTILKVAADPPAVFLSTSVLTLAKLPIRPPTRPLVMIARSAERAGVMTGERKSYRRGA